LAESCSAAQGCNEQWPVLRHYDENHLTRIALPLGGIGTGTISIGGRGDLRDWEIMNRPAKGYIPVAAKGGSSVGPFFALYVRRPDGETITRAVEGPIDSTQYEGAFGSTLLNHGLPRFRQCSFAAAYPLGQVLLSDPDVPVEVTIEAFNPLVPADAETSGIPVAILRYVLHNKTDETLEVSVCGNVPNFIGPGGRENEFRKASGVQGIFMRSPKTSGSEPGWGSFALATTTEGRVTYRTSWVAENWGGSLLDFWDDFGTDGKVQQRSRNAPLPMTSVAVGLALPPLSSSDVTFLLTWHFPNRITWTPKRGGQRAAKDEGTGDRRLDDPDRVGNYYATRFGDAWDVAQKVAAKLPELERATVRFVDAFCRSDLPEVVKEAALFNVSTLRTETCFRTEDGRFFGFEGCGDTGGCCHGSCTHVWNYEQATGFLFGELAKSMRKVEFGSATNDEGLMSFRVNLPLDRAQDFARAAADGQMGSIMRMYRDWQLSGDDEMLRTLWPQIKKSLEFCWIKGGWDANKDGVMEGCQHNTMDVEYYGPNPQMGIWYLGALRAAGEMALYVGDERFAGTCRTLLEQGSDWIDENLFNGEYYEHQIRPPTDDSDIAPALRVGMGAKDLAKPDFQLGSGCLVDQLVGQYMAHVCGLGYLVDPANVRTTLRSIMKYNLREGMHGHFNNMRSFVMGDESGLLMASYPKGRPERPFPYFAEVMTGFEYAAAVGMLYEDLTEDGLRCIANIRDRYDGRKRSPFDEAECGHHYARAMASWAAVLALTEFHYSGVDKSMTIKPQQGTFFWSNGYAWGTCNLKVGSGDARISLSILHGDLALSRFALKGFGEKRFEKTLRLQAGDESQFRVDRK